MLNKTKLNIKNLMILNQYLSKIKVAFKYLKHWTFARNSKGFGIHSPYIFHLVTQIINDSVPFYCFADIEKERRSHLHNHQSITVTDFGAGSKVLKNKKKRIAQIARHSLKPKRQAQLLFKLINHFDSQHILELGSSLGITTSYMASVSSQSKIITLEGCPNLSKIAQQSFTNLKLSNIEIITGNFSTTLNHALTKLKTIDFIFFDGNHAKAATLDYFASCLPFKHNGTVFVFDDIHLSQDMEGAWNEIKNNTEVKVTLDLFHLGIVFFKKEFTKQHFNIRF